MLSAPDRSISICRARVGTLESLLVCIILTVLSPSEVPDETTSLALTGLVLPIPTLPPDKIVSLCVSLV